MTTYYLFRDTEGTIVAVAARLHVLINRTDYPGVLFRGRPVPGYLAASVIRQFGGRWIDESRARSPNPNREVPAEIA